MNIPVRKIPSGVVPAVNTEKMLLLLSLKHIFSLFFSLTIQINSFVIFALSLVFARKTAQRRELFLCGAVSFAIGLPVFLNSDPLRLFIRQSQGLGFLRCISEADQNPQKPPETGDFILYFLCD